LIGDPVLRPRYTDLIYAFEVDFILIPENPDRFGFACHVHVVVIAGNGELPPLTLQIDRSVVSGHGHHVRLGLRAHDSDGDEPARTK
jgi:hypothetical protein